MSYRLTILKGGDVKIQVKKPETEELEENGVFDWYYDTDETCYLLEGEVKLILPDGESVAFGAGDMVHFPEGLSCEWEWDISVPVKKHFRMG